MKSVVVLCSLLFYWSIVWTGCSLIRKWSLSIEGEEAKALLQDSLIKIDSHCSPHRPRLANYSPSPLSQLIPCHIPGQEMQSTFLIAAKGAGTSLFSLYRRQSSLPVYMFLLYVCREEEVKTSVHFWKMCKLAVQILCMSAK